MADGDSTVIAQIAADTQTNAAVIRFVDEADPPNPVHLANQEKQDAGNASLVSIDGKTPALVSGRQPVDGSGVTQPVSAASLPLPTGAATETTLAAANAKIPSDPAREGGNLATIAGKDFATQATLAALLAKLYKVYPTVTENFTAAGNGTTVDATSIPPTKYALQVVRNSGTSVVWSIVGEVSIDGGSQWTTVVQCTDTTPGTGNIKFSSATPQIGLLYRIRCISIGGTLPDVTAKLVAYT